MKAKQLDRNFETLNKLTMVSFILANIFAVFAMLAPLILYLALR